MKMKIQRKDNIWNKEEIGGKYGQLGFYEERGNQDIYEKYECNMESRENKKIEILRNFEKMFFIHPVFYWCCIFVYIGGHY